jgi:hypothetical protein
VIVVAALEAPTVIAGFHDIAMVSQTIQQCGGHLCVADHGTMHLFQNG